MHNGVPSQGVCVHVTRPVYIFDSMQSEMVDFTPGAATWRTGRSI